MNSLLPAFHLPTPIPSHRHSLNKSSNSNGFDSSSSYVRCAPSMRNAKLPFPYNNRFSRSSKSASNSSPRPIESIVQTMYSNNMKQKEDDIKSDNVQEKEEEEEKEEQSDIDSDNKNTDKKVSASVAEPVPIDLDQNQNQNPNDQQRLFSIDEQRMEKAQEQEQEDSVAINSHETKQQQQQQQSESEPESEPEPEPEPIIAEQIEQKKEQQTDHEDVDVPTTPVPTVTAVATVEKEQDVVSSTSSSSSSSTSPSSVPTSESTNSSSAFSDSPSTTTTTTTTRLNGESRNNDYTTSFSPKDLPSVVALQNDAEKLNFDSNSGDNNNNDNNDDNNNNNNNDNNDDENKDDDEERTSLIQSLRLNDTDAKYATLQELRQLFQATQLPFIGWIASHWPALRDRLGANPRLPLQLSIEITVGVVTKTLAELQGRGKKFWREFDFYLSDIALEIFGDAILVWLLSPVLLMSMKPSATTNTGLLSMTLPKHFAQIGSFGIGARIIGFAYKALQFGIAGFLSSVVGHGLTRTLVSVREANKMKSATSNTKEEEEDDDKVELAPILKTSLAWAGFLATSSNLRYQMVNGFEQRVLDPLLGKNFAALAIVTFVLRFGNCYVGSLHWLPWAKMWDLQ